MSDLTMWLLLGLGTWLAVSVAATALLARGGLAYLTRDERGSRAIVPDRRSSERHQQPGSPAEPAAAALPGEPDSVSGPDAAGPDASQPDATGSLAKDDGESTGNTPAERRL